MCKIFKQYFIALAVMVVVLIYIGRHTDIDLRLADWMYDFSSQSFPWNENWFVTVFMHRWIKILFIGFALILFFCLAVNGAYGMVWFSPATHYRLYVVALSSAIIPFVVSILKSVSIHACPWNLERYGGHAPYLRILERIPDGVVAGHCFPAGHASSALWLAAFSVLWLPHRPKAAVLAFTLLSVPGLVIGWVQQMRGAHFFTHTLWSMWISSLMINLIALLIFMQFKDEIASK